MPCSGVVYRVLVLLLTAAALTACNDEGASSSTSSSADDAPRYAASLTVLESPDHGPELCFHVFASNPPQCDGLSVSGWDWAEVDEEETANGTTWGEFRVVGTFDGTRLTLSETPGRATEPPDIGASGDQPVESGSASDEELERVREEVFGAEARRSLRVEGGYSDPQRRIIVAHVWVADDEATAYAQERWGDLVELQGILQPVP
jgi:hypothetical protein